MDWLDYREKLGIGFNDEEKVNYFYRKMFNVSTLHSAMKLGALRGVEINTVMATN